LCKGWLILFKELLEGGSDLHAVSKSHKTPLLSVVDSCLDFDSSIDNIDKSISIKLTRRITPWLRTLKEVGVNLSSYGRKEKELIQSLSLQTYFEPYNGWNIPISNVHPGLNIPISVVHLECNIPIHDVHLSGFEYGPEPEDWKFWVYETIDEYAGDFWYMIENPWETDGRRLDRLIWNYRYCLYFLFLI